MIMRALRRHRAEKAIQKQLKIARRNGLPVDQPNRYRKQHAMDCGNPQCSVCSNLRYNKQVSGMGKLTIQERRILERLKYELDEANSASLSEQIQILESL